MTTMKLTKDWLTVYGIRCGIRLDAGPWVPGVPTEQIKVRPKRGRFPREFLRALQIDNDSDAMTDHFEDDCIRLMPGHPLYAAARAAIAKATQP